MKSTRNAGQPPRDVGAIPIQGPQSVIGFIPPGVIDPDSHMITLEVVLTFTDDRTMSVPLRISRSEFVHRARVARPARPVADLRQWLVERAHQQLATGQSDSNVSAELMVQATIFWVYPNRARHEPFLL
jgi:hypothetical protein